VVAPDPFDPPETPGQGVERELLIPAPPEGIYIHFPFCVSLCPYCDFVVFAGSAARGPRSRVGALTAALHQELDLRAERLAKPVALQSVYIGGGTPSLLEPAEVESLLGHIDRRIGIATGAEVTLETNPGADEVGDMRGFRTAGVNRVSLGAQTMDVAELRRLGRRHRPADVVAAVGMARTAGIGSISLDLLTDIPGQTLASWRASLAAAIALDPDHLSVYTLTLDDPEAEGLTGPDGDHLPVSRGARAWRDRAVFEQSDDRAAEMEIVTDEMAAVAGIERYEVANLARDGHQSRHNLLYWRRRPYLALGPGAHASDGALRREWNAARLDRYLSALADGRLPPGGSETIDPATALAERAILGLRLSRGLDAATASAPGVADTLGWAVAEGLAEETGGYTRLTQRGRLLANEVFGRLLPE
jgi:oxygen-independent coproporphyrinogen-3 oxidase